MTFRSRLLNALTWGVVITLPSHHAFAQDVTPNPPEDEDEATIVVTGSRIESQRTASPAPVVQVEGESIIGHTGRVSLGDELNELPQFRTTLSQASSTANTAPSQVGLNLLDLRGLGLSRTLVLQNGRRHVSGSQVVAQPDVNTIPPELLARIDILTGGASAVYGADAIAGVVNFVLRDDFEGVQARGQAGISAQGDAAAYLTSLTAGTNFLDDRGNVAVSLAYARRDRLRNADRDFARFQQTFVPNFADTDRLRPPGTPPDGIPDQILIRDLRLLALSTGGTISLAAPAGQPPRIFRFASDGSLNPADFGRGQFLPLAPVSDGGDGFNSFGTTTLLPDYERWAVNLLGHFDFSDSLRLFIEGKVNWVGATTFVQGTSSFLTFSTTNPFLTDQARAQLAAILPPGATSFSMLRVNEDLGVTGDNSERLTWRGVIGLQGALSEDWDFEFSYSYGRTEVDSNFLNSILPARLAFAADAVRDTAGVLGTPGAIVCRARLQAGNAATGNPDIDQCVPVNLFGSGSPSSAARDFVTVDTRAKGVLQQHLINGFVRGDTSGFLNLPGGPIAIVAGFEYREDSTAYNPDALDLSGQTSLVGFQAIAGALKVLEGYAEVRVPLLANRPGAELLELTGAVRVADYNLTGVGVETSWGGGIVYAPLPDARFRGSYQRAARAPNIAELFQPVVPTRFSVFDPCSEGALAQGSASRSANCTALGRPAGFVANTIGSTVPGTIGGNPNLDVERAETWTAGVVFTPRFLPRFSLTIDYYNIKLDDAITSINVNTILNQCVDEPSTDNVFCPLITRGPDFNIVNIDQRAVNLTRLEASGVDVDASYSVELGGESRLNLRALATYIIDRNDFLSPSLPDFPTQIVETVGLPRFAAQFSTNLALGNITLSHDLRYFSSQYRRPVADFESVGGEPARNPDALPDEFRETGDRFVHDARIGIRFGGESEFYLGVDNLFDSEPPPGINGAGFGGANFDNIGRFFYAGVVIRM